MLVVKIRTINDVSDDLERITYNDPNIERALDNLRAQTYLAKRPYRELLMSKLFGTIKYLLQRDPDGTIRITDLDTNITYITQ